MFKHKRLAIAALAVAAAGMTGGCATPFPTTVGGPPTTSSATPATSTPPPTSPTSVSTSPPVSTSAPVAGSPCTVAMLSYDSMRGEGAMGTAFSTYTFHNGGPVSCRVQGPPELTYVDDHGATLPVPVEHDATGGPVTVQPGGKVQFVAHEINGYGGYQPGAPQCAHPATYRHVSVALPGGAVSLGADGTMSVQCGSITVGSWAAPGS